MFLTQTNSALDAPVRRGGCLLMMHVSIPAEMRKRGFSPEEINEIHALGVDRGIYTTNARKNAFVENHVESIKLCGEVLGVRLREVIYVGIYLPNGTWRFHRAGIPTHFGEQVSVIGHHSHFRRLCGYDSYPGLQLGGIQTIRAYRVIAVPDEIAA